MTDYNDGKWHGWNGGECPVHQASLVDIVTEGGIAFPESYAGSIGGWERGHPNPIVAFRVIKPYTEPREWWTVGLRMFETPEEARKFLDDLGDAYPYKGYDKQPIIHVREVTE